MCNKNELQALHIISAMSFCDTNKLSIAREFLKHFKNYQHAFVFKEIVHYWSLKKGDWNYCSAREMGEELELSIDQVRRSYKFLIKGGYIETKKRMVFGSPTLDFKINPVKFNEVFSQPAESPVAPDHVAESPVACGGIASSITTITTTITKPNNKHTVIDVESQFTRLYEAYPKKVKKQKSRMAYKRIVKGKSQLWVDDFTNKLINNFGQRLDAGDWNLNEKKWIPSLEAYLNGQRWEDELQTQAPPVSNKLMTRLKDRSWADHLINPPPAQINDKPATYDHM